jgi:hypothetical protein
MKRTRRDDIGVTCCGHRRHNRRSTLFSRGPFHRHIPRVASPNTQRQGAHAMSLILIIILLIILFGALPTWPYSRGWGYYPSGGLGLVLVIVIILLLLGYI